MTDVKSMDWILYDRDLYHKRVNHFYNANAKMLVNQLSMIINETFPAVKSIFLKCYNIIKQQSTVCILLPCYIMCTPPPPSQSPFCCRRVGGGGWTSCKFRKRGRSGWQDLTFYSWERGGRWPFSRDVAVLT